jgi:hypothetical protein
MEKRLATMSRLYTTAECNFEPTNLYRRVQQEVNWRANIMSWVTDVLLIFSLEEFYSEDGNRLESILALDNINSWLEENGKGSLGNLNEYAGGGKAMQACVYGGAFNFLKIDEFIKVVKEQSWRMRENVQLLLQDEEDECFTMHTLLEHQQDS